MLEQAIQDSDITAKEGMKIAHGILREYASRYNGTADALNARLRDAPAGSRLHAIASGDAGFVVLPKQGHQIRYKKVFGKTNLGAFAPTPLVLVTFFVVFLK